MTTPTPMTDAAIIRDKMILSEVGPLEIVDAGTSRQLERELAAAQERIRELETALLGVKEYREKNPLGGPAKVFDAMADAIRAGDDFNAVCADYGWCPLDRAIAAEARAEASERDAQRYRKCRRNGGFFFTSDCMTDDEVDAEIDALPDHAAIAEGKK